MRKIKTIARIKGPGFESYAAVSNLGEGLFTQHCYNAFNCLNVYMVIDSKVSQVSFEQS